ncbi:tetratricopeptide repeat protein [Shimia sp.]|uniref:tetratricopeptide repeat protein n=1 Tax=Shimia sp. TaxID=1954381 RepID=UPI003BAD78F8
MAAASIGLVAVCILANKHLGFLPHRNICLTQRIADTVVEECTTLLAQGDLSDQTRADVLFRRALMTTKQDPEAARSDYHAVLELRPDWTWPLHNLGLIYLNRDEPATALPLFDRALEIDPDAHHRRTSRAKAYFLLERYTEALADTEIVLKHDTDNSLAQVLHGRSLAQLGAHDRALAFYSKILLEDGDHSRVRRERAGLYFRDLDLSSHAEIDLRHALKQNSEDRRALALLGYVLLHKKRYPEARKAFEHALAIKPDYGYARRGLTRLEREVTETQEANTRLSTPLGREIAGPAFGTVLARSYADLGDTARALVEYDAVLSQEPDNVFAHSGKAKVFQRLDRHEQAIDAFEGVFASVEPQAGGETVGRDIIEQIYTELGYSYHPLGRGEEALKAWKMGLTNARENDVSLWQLRLHSAGHFSGPPDGKINDAFWEGLEACSVDIACLN